MTSRPSAGGRFATEALASHPRGAFSCGNAELDRYFHERVGQDQRTGAARCFLMVDLDADVIAGFYTLSSTAVDATTIARQVQAALKRKLPLHYGQVPAILLGRMAVDLRYQSQGTGRALLTDALRRAKRLSYELGSAMVVVDPQSPEVAPFYQQYGFEPLTDSPVPRLFIRMDDVEL